MGSHSWQGKPRLCRCCMTVKFPGWPRANVSKLGAPKQGSPTKKYGLFGVCQTFQAFLLLRGGNYVFESGKTLWFQKYSFFERAKAINISATTNEPQYASKFSTDIIIAPENRCDSFFWIKKTFCNSEINQPNGHISISPSRDILDTFPLWYFGIGYQTITECVKLRWFVA